MSRAIDGERLPGGFAWLGTVPVADSISQSAAGHGTTAISSSAAAPFRPVSLARNAQVSR